MSSPNPLEAYYADEEETLAKQPEQPEANPLEQYYSDTPTEDNRPKTDWAGGYVDESRVESTFGEKLQELRDFKSGIYSGTTAGLSNLIPEIEGVPQPNKDSKFYKSGEMIGSILPIETLSNVFVKPLVKFAEKSPILKKQLSSLASIIGWGASGFTEKAAKDAFQGKMPDIDDLIEHGSQWAAIDAGLKTLGGLGKFAAWLYKAATKSSKPVYSVLNDTINKMKSQGVDFSKPEVVNAKALSILEETANPAPKQAKPQTVKKVEQKPTDRLNPDDPALAEPYVPGQFDVVEVIDNSNRQALDGLKENISQRAATELELGANVQGSINEGLESAKAEYKPAYDLAEEAGSTINSTPLKVGEVGTKTLQDLEAIKTKPAGYQTVINTIETAMEDAGWKIQREEGLKSGRIIQVIGENQVSTDKLMALGRRLNEIVSYDVLDATVQDRLKPLIKAVKQDIRTALAKNPEALEMWNKAEADFGDQARRFGRDSIRKIRLSQTPEQIAKMIRSPSVLQDLKATVSTQQYAQIEREILEHLDKLAESKANDVYRELRPHLSLDAQAVAEDILESKLPPANPTRRQAAYDKVQNSALEELSKASATGQRPETALKLWKTPRGQQLIKHALDGNPQKQEMLNYLEKQSFNDFATSVVSPDGKINFKKLNEFIKDPATRENLRLIGGDEAVAFFDNLQSMSNKMKKNVELIERKTDKGSFKDRKEMEDYLAKKSERGKEILDRMKRKDYPLKFKVDDFFSSLGFNPKQLLTLFGITHFGLPAVAETIAGQQGLKFLTKMATKPKFRTSIRKATAPKKTPVAVFSAIDELDEALSE